MSAPSTVPALPPPATAPPGTLPLGTLPLGTLPLGTLPLCVGIDVAKAFLVVARGAQDAQPCTIDNTPQAIKGLLHKLPPGSRLGVAATNRYHQLLADLGHAAGHTVYVLNPLCA